ncbi:MAG: CBM96 family carbohydrate-binding protein [Tepidisphaeraceae bacterium]
MVRTFFRKSANPRVRAAVLEVLETRQFFDATLTPTADTFVRDGTSAGNVYGSYALLQSKQGAAGVQRQIYEKFDLSGLSGSISHATLQIYGNRSNTNDSTFSIAAAGMSDNSWSEGSTTWNNKPAVGSTLNTASVTSTTKGLINLDVTSYLQQAQTNGQTTVSIAIVGTANTDAYFEMSSREGTNSPQLILTTGATAPAAPTNLTAPSVQTNAVTLNWADNSNNETGFQVQRKQGTGAWATLTTTSANATSYIDTTVSAGQSYSYQVIAVNAAGSSASSNTVNASVPAASTTTFTPTADTYVRDSTFSSTTFGTSGTAAARLSTTSTNNRQIYLKFDLSSLSGSVSSATLNVYGYRSNTNDSTFAIAAAQMSDNSWTESSTDWDNKPAVGSTISTANVPNTSYQWISLDVSSYIQAAKANIQSVVSIAIVGAAATTD